MLDKLKELALRYEDLEAQLSDPAVYGDAARLRQINRERKELGPVVETYLAYLQAEQDRAEAEELLHDPDFHELAQEELTSAKLELERLREKLRLLLLPRDPNDERNVIMELRGGVGGEEGALFAHSLLRMYTMYAQSKGWKIDIVNMNETELGGVKECSVVIEGEGAFSRLKFESGVHRVQRVPETESGGRIHTSAGGRGSGRGTESGGCRDAGVPFLRRRWPACQQDVLRSPAYPQAHRNGGGVSAGAEPVPEPGQGHADSGIQTL